MGSITRTYTESSVSNPVAAGQKVLADHLNADLNQLFTLVNGNIEGNGVNIKAGTIVNADINASAAIDISKTTLGTFTDWTTWTPTIAVSGGTAPTYTADFVNRYTRIGKLVVAQITWNNNAGGTAGSGANAVTFTLPIAPLNTATTIYAAIGIGNYRNGAATSIINVAINDATTAFFLAYDTSTITGNAQSDAFRRIRATLAYEVA